MRNILWAALLVWVSLWSKETAMGQVYVAAAGDDDAEGTQAKPVATLARAVDMARQKGLKQIVVGGGKYYDVGVTLGSEDSGLTIEGAPGEQPVLVGGVKVSNWEKDGNFVAAKLPEGRQWDVRLLQVAGRMCGRARFPGQGVLQCLNVFDVPWMSSSAGGWQRPPTAEELSTLKYKEGDLPVGMEMRNAEVRVYHSWDESCVGVTANDVAAHVLTLSPAATYPPGGFKHHEYVLWNVREGMTAPGEWYWDRVANRVVYWPQEGEDMAKAEVVVPTQYSIVAIRGDAKGQAKDVVLRNLAFEVTTVPLLAAGFAAEKYAGAVEMDQVTGVRLEGLTIRQVAGQAIRTNPKGRCDSVTVEGCTASECGAGGIYVWGNGTVIRNNLVHGVGQAYPSAEGLHGQGKDCQVSHNEVYDTTYSAIDFRGENVLVEANRLHDFMKVLHDGAAIYIFEGKNCTMRGNVAHGGEATDAPGAPTVAYYLDEGCQGCTVEGNLAVDVATPLHNHMAKGNTIRGNVLVTQGDMRMTIHKSTEFVVEGNIFYASGGKVRLESGADTVWRGNVEYSGTDKLETVRVEWSTPKETSPDAAAGSVVVNPGFLDPEHEDYRVADDSPAGKAGVHGVDGRNAGRLN